MVAQQFLVLLVQVRVLARQLPQASSTSQQAKTLSLFYSTATIRPSCGAREISRPRKPGHIALPCPNPPHYLHYFHPVLTHCAAPCPPGLAALSYHLLHPGSTTRMATAPLPRRVAHAPLRTPVNTCPHAPRLRLFRHPPQPPHPLIPPNSPTPSDNPDYPDYSSLPAGLGWP